MCLVLYIDVYFSFPWFYTLENISALTADMPLLVWPVFSNTTSPSRVVHKIDTLSQGDTLLIECAGNQVTRRSLPFYPTKRESHKGHTCLPVHGFIWANTV